MVKKSLIWFYRFALTAIWLVLIFMSVTIIGLRYFVLPEISKYQPKITQAISNSSDNAMAHYNRALARLRMDYKAAACDDLQRAADLGYESATVLLKIHCQKANSVPVKENK